MLLDFCKHLVVRTPLEPSFLRLRAMASMALDVKHPEIWHLQAEDYLLDQLYERFLRRDSNCVDVGAHLGFQLSRYSRLAPEGRHIAFEPVARKAEWLRRKFPELTIHHAAVGPQSGSVSFFVDTRRSAYSGLSANMSASASSEEVTVDMVRLDDVIANERVDLLKIDVEGHELGVLQGATQLCERWRPIVVFESTQTGLDAASSSPLETFAWFDANAFAVYLPGDFIHGAAKLSSAEFARCHRYPFRGFNFLAIPNERT